MPEYNIPFYPNSLCFSNKMKVPAYSNWFHDKFNSIYLSFDMCNNSTYSNVTDNKYCQSKDNIAEFMKSNIFYVKV